MKRLKSFSYFEPATLPEAVGILAEKGDEAFALAGGTDLLVRMKREDIRPSALVNLKRIDDLNLVKKVAGKGTTIGALVPISDIGDSPCDTFESSGADANCRGCRLSVHKNPCHNWRKHRKGIPLIVLIIFEVHHKEGPFGAKGIGEPAAAATAPAIANAVFDAVGVRIKDLPVTREKVPAALKEKK